VFALASDGSILSSGSPCPVPDTRERRRLSAHPGPSPTRGIVGSSTIGIGVSASPAWEILVQARSKDCGQHGAAGPDPHLA
jgi:hypothetical protein